MPDENHPLLDSGGRNDPAEYAGGAQPERAGTKESKSARKGAKARKEKIRVWSRMIADKNDREIFSALRLGMNSSAQSGKSRRFPELIQNPQQ